MKRLLTALIALTALGVAVPSAAVGSQEPDVTVRIVARRVDDGRVEFALQQQTDGDWGERILPSRRFFPVDVETGRWLASSSLTLEAETRTGDCPTLRPGVTDVRSIPAGEQCIYSFEAGEVSYWARLSGFGGTLDEIIANGVPLCAATVVAISGSDVGFEWTDSC